MSSLLSGSALSGQSVTVGAKMGAVHSTHTHRVEQSDLSSSRDRWGMSAGLVLRLSVTEWLAVQGEALYSEKGSEDDRGFEIRNRYIEAPLALRLSVPVSLFGVEPVLLGGVAPATEIGCSAKAVPPHIPELPRPEPQPYDCDNFRTARSDLGWVLGGGISTAVFDIPVTLETRYTHGARDLASGFDRVELRSKSLAILLEAALPLRIERR